MSVIASGVIEPADWSNVGGSGRSMSQLGDEWWIRAFGIPEKLNPFVKDDLTDPRGRRGSVERAYIANIASPDPIFFLGGSFESRGDLPNPVRTVVVPKHAVLVFPTINGALPDGVEHPPGHFPDEAETRRNVNHFFEVQDNEGNLVELNTFNFTVKVDGISLEDESLPSFEQSKRNTDYRRESPDGGFKYILPRGNAFGVPKQKVKPAVADGYWFAYDTKSLLSGEDHTVNFTGRLEIPPEEPSEEPFVFELDVTYKILNPIVGTYRRDKLSGTEFNDYIRGKTGKDSLSGLDGDDLILGGWGRDTIDGGSGDDELWGDFGKDTFIFKAGYGKDTIFDFARKEVVKIEGFTEYDSLKNVTLDSGVSAAQIDFGKHDILTLIGVDSKHLLFDFDDGTITLEHRFSI